MGVLGVSAFASIGLADHSIDSFSFASNSTSVNVNQSLSSIIDNQHRFIESLKDSEQDLGFFGNTLVYYMHIEPEMTLNPSGSPFLSQLTALNFLKLSLSSKHESIWIKDHPHLTQLLSGEYSELYKKYRAELQNLCSNNSFFQYLGLSVSSKQIMSTKCVPISVSGDIVFESSLLGKNSLLLSNQWWNLTDHDRESLGIFDMTRFHELDSYESFYSEPCSDLIESRINHFYNFCRSSFIPQPFYMTEATIRSSRNFMNLISSKSASAIINVISLP